MRCRSATSLHTASGFRALAATDLLLQPSGFAHLRPQAFFYSLRVSRTCGHKPDMKWLDRAGQIASLAPRRKFYKQVNEFVESREDSALHQELFSTSLRFDSAYWRLQHCWCVLEAGRAGHTTCDAQKTFKTLWNASYRSQSLTDLDVRNIVLDWAEAVRAELRSALECLAAPDGSEDPYSRPAGSHEAVIKAAEPSPLPFEAIAPILVQDFPENDEELINTALAYIAEAEDPHSRPAAYYSHKDMATRLLARPHTPEYKPVGDTRNVINGQWKALAVALESNKSAEEQHSMCAGWQQRVARHRNKQTNDVRYLQQNRFALKLFWGDARHYELDCGDNPTAQQALVIENGRLQIIFLCQHVVRHLNNLRQSLQNATRQMRHRHQDKSFSDLALFPVLHACSAGSILSWDEVVENCTADEDCHAATTGPYGLQELVSIARCFRDCPVIRLKDLKQSHPKFLPHAKVQDFIGQLCKLMPLMALELRLPKPCRQVDENVVLMSVNGMVGTTACYFWSMLIQMDEAWRGDAIDSNQVDGSFFEPEVPEVDEPCDDEVIPVVRKVRRPRIEDDRMHGHAIVDFVKDFLLSRGQSSMDSCHRLRTSTTVISASLNSIRKAALSANYPISRSAIYNLLAPPKRNSVFTNQRRVIDARVSRTVGCMTKWHPRAAHSASLMKYGSQFLTLLKGNGFRTAEPHLDSMSKLPYYIMAKPGGKCPSFVMQREEGLPALVVFFYSP